MERRILISAQKIKNRGWQINALMLTNDNAYETRTLTRILVLLYCRCKDSQILRARKKEIFEVQRPELTKLQYFKINRGSSFLFFCGLKNRRLGLNVPWKFTVPLGGFLGSTKNSLTNRSVNAWQHEKSAIIENKNGVWSPLIRGDDWWDTN